MSELRCGLEDCKGCANPDEAMTEQEYLELCKTAKCKWDQAPLTPDLQMYNHSGGWSVKDKLGKLLVHKQWLSRACTKCGYEWSLWKLGVSRETPQVD